MEDSLSFNYGKQLEQYKLPDFESLNKRNLGGLGFFWHAGEAPSPPTAADQKHLLHRQTQTGSELGLGEGDQDEKSELGLGEGKEHHGDHFSCSTREMVQRRRHCAEHDGILLVVRPKRRDESWYSKYSCFLKGSFQQLSFWRREVSEDSRRGDFKKLFSTKL
jgi:hypothetical protein